MFNMGTLIPLGISLNYQVNWNFKAIIRDLIQNFYDSIGWKNFHNEFMMDFNVNNQKHGTLVMQTKDHPFSYEWLIHIGGSTKTNSPEQYAGMYGEGFKICALQLFKMGCRIRMESSDWVISICKYSKTIDGRRLPMLGYRRKNRKDDGYTRLTVFKLDSKYAEDIEESPLNYFYPENPLLGQKIARGKNYAIYFRSADYYGIPCKRTFHPISGALFCNGIARGRLNVNLMIMINRKNIKYDERNRKTLDYHESMAFLNNYSFVFDSYASYQLLMYLKSYWSEVPKVTVDLKTWYYVICQLVRNISKNKKYKRKFMKKYPRLIYVDRAGMDPGQKRLIDEASKWSGSNPAYRGYIKVNPVFRLLGARSVIRDYLEFCKRPVVHMNDIQKLRCDILFCAFEDIYPFKIYDTRPQVILVNGFHSDQMQYCEKIYDHKTGRIKFKIHKVVLDVSLFCPNCFIDAFLALAEALLHVYGTSKSKRMNSECTELISCLIDEAQIFNRYMNIWKETTESENNNIKERIS